MVESGENFHDYQEGVLVGGVLVLDRKMQKAPTKKKASVNKYKWVSVVFCIICFILACIAFPSMTMTLILSVLVTLCLYEWIPESWMTKTTSPRKHEVIQRSNAQVSQFANNEKMMAEVSVANIFFHVRKVKICESKPSLFQITVTFRVHRWHTWRYHLEIFCTSTIF
jgi:hypothetical protein